MAMTIKNASEIDKMHAAGRLVGEIHVRLREAIAPGATTAELDRIAAEVLAAHGATSSFLGYHGYPAT
ncbi:MAG TPA: type I methionyl aminopeptidase, partial [Thermomicrobiales bacterium]|nr:type I methionyl aminopeptidase [Thermomicrobiales bacterium]